MEAKINTPPFFGDNKKPTQNPPFILDLPSGFPRPVRETALAVVEVDEGTKVK